MARSRLACPSVAVARYFANRNNLPLPSAADQRTWETDCVAKLGLSNAFHAIGPYFEPYFNWLVDFSGQPALGTDGYALPRWDDKWATQGLAILGLKDKYWRRLIAQEEAIKAKL